MKYRYLHVDEDYEVQGTNDPLLAKRIVEDGFYVYDAKTGTSVETGASIRELDPEQWFGDPPSEEEDDFEEDEDEEEDEEDEE